VAERQRKQRQALQPGDEQVGVADPASFHAHQRFAGTGLSEAVRHHRDPASGRRQHRRHSLQITHQARCYHQVNMRFISFAWLIAFPVWPQPMGAVDRRGSGRKFHQRAQAIAALGTIRTAEADKLVQAVLKDKESIVRLEAVNALAERKSRAAIRA